MKKTDQVQPCLQSSQAYPVSALSSVQLRRVKENLDLEIQALTSNVVDLRYALKSFQESKRALDGLGTEAEGKEVMIPLTQSVYVPARLVETDKVLVDIGAGYHAQKSLPEAKEYCEGKIQFIGETCTKALKAISEKKRFTEMLAAQQRTIQPQK